MSAPARQKTARKSAGTQEAARGWADGPLLAFDLESTAADPMTARIVTATTIKISGRTKQVTNWLSDVDGNEIPEAAAAIHGISTEHARAHGRPLREVVPEVAETIFRAWIFGTPVVGHNVSYDLTVLAEECKRFGLPPFDVRGPVVDSIVLDRGTHPWRKGKRTLSATCEHYGITLDNAHSSDADALASARIAWKIARKYPKVGRLSLDELMTWQRNAHRKWADGFGAYLVKQGKDDDVSREWPLRGAA